MKKSTLLLTLILLVLFSCENNNDKKVIDSWKTEMNLIKQGHQEALSILDGFETKINTHKKDLSDFTSHFENEVANGTKSDPSLEDELVKKINENIIKHEKFALFLNNLRALQGSFENKSFELQDIPAENTISNFASLKDATTYWVLEEDNINAGHNEALSIIRDLEDKIFNHQKLIQDFTTKIQNERVGKREIEELKTNYSINKDKHENFMRFFNNLKKVQEQFED